MQREIQLTADGSHTVAIPEMKVTYHSHHGAINESMHVYIQAGLIPLINPSANQTLHILEIGFGTGLNALLTLQKATMNQQRVYYSAIEFYPLTIHEITTINHGYLLSLQDDFLKLHASVWEQDIWFNEFFLLKKMNVSLLHSFDIKPVNCIYFDPFSPLIQPGLWTTPVFKKLYHVLMPGGVLVTYCSKTVVRRAMEAAGFEVTKITGPYGKREMVKALKR